MGASIELHNVSKTFGGYTAVDNVSLAVEEGQFLTLLGASGSGKTTTLRLIAGLEAPTQGKIYFRGEDITDVPVTQRPMRMVFQDYALFPNLSVYENIAFGLKLRSTRGRYGTQDIDKLVRRHLEVVHLADHSKKLPHQLSGGQKQRVALARALITDPPVVLFDEPLGSLDANLRKAMQVELKRVHRELGKTFIYVTHDQDEAMAMSDRIAVMQDAKLLQIGTPEQIYNEPNSKAVASFIGAANVVEGTVQGGERGCINVRLPDGQTVNVAANGHIPENGHKVLLMMRAERFKVGRSAGSDATNWLHGRVTERLFLGKKVEYQVTLPGTQAVLSVIDRDFESRGLSVDQAIDFGIAPHHIRLLDA